MQEYDKSSKWLIQHYGASILRLAGVHDIESWRPLQAEVVQPRQLPDGLIEALLRGRSKPDLFVLELATYPEARLVEQVLRDMTLVYLDRREVPDVITVVLHPKGNLRVSGEVERTSPERMTRWQRELEGRRALDAPRRVTSGRWGCRTDSLGPLDSLRWSARADLPGMP